MRGGRGAGARDVPRLAERIDQLAGNLSGGEQQMLAISQALIPDPKLLLIDELSLGLAPTIVGQLIDVVHQIHETGLTIVVVEQSINVALRLAERAVFMEKGEFRFTGSTQELLDRPDILRSVFIAGASAGAATPATASRRRRRRRREGRSPRRRPSGSRPGRTRRSSSSADERRRSASAASSRSTTSTSSCGRARSSASSARTAPARRRCSTASPASCPIDGGRVLLRGEDITDLRAARAGRARARPVVPGGPALPVAHHRRRRSPSPASATS